MILVSLSLAVVLQLAAVTLASAPVRPSRPAAADSTRDLQRARGAQADFERARRNALAWEAGGGGRCDVRVGRFCWWYDGTLPSLPPESDRIVQRRMELIAELDALGVAHPGDEWLAGMRVHYRVEAGRAGDADSVVKSCRTAAWWCAKLAGYAAHSIGDAARAESLFASADSMMPTDRLCRWRNISTLLAGEARSRYASLSCEARASVERRYWVVTHPRLSLPANEWRNEFETRRVQSVLAEQSRNPQPTSWGEDAEELVLRYGWPNAWTRVTPTSSAFGAEPAIIGHEPSPSFDFAPDERVLLDSSSDAGDDAWRVDDPRSVSRYAPPGIKRLAPVSAQFARFRRGDSTLLVSAFSANDDSLPTAHPVLAALIAGRTGDGMRVTTVADGGRRGLLRLMLPGEPSLAGVEMLDTGTHTLARSRRAFAVTGGARRISDLLVYRGSDDVPTTLEDAVARAIPGDSLLRGDPIGLFWETYAPAATADTAVLSISIERIDRGILHGLAQRFGLGDPDSPIRVHWSAPPAVPRAITAQAISLDSTELEGGRYRIFVSVARGSFPPLVAARELTVQAP